MTTPEPRPLEGKERCAVRADGREHSCRECWRAHIIHSDDGRTVTACTGRSFQDTQEGE